MQSHFSGYSDDPSSTNGARLLRACWFALASAFVAVFTFAIFTVVRKGQSPHATEAAVQPAAENQKEARRETPPLSDDASTMSSNYLSRADEVDGVVGDGFAAPHRDDSHLLSPAPPPLHRDDPAPPPPEPPTPPKSAASNPPPKLLPTDNNPSLPAKSAPLDADVAVEKRLQASEEESRAQLLAVPELRLASDRDYAFNAQLNEAMLRAGAKAGLPLKPGQLDRAAAMVVQTLSKDLRDMGFVSVPGTPVRVRSVSGKVANVGATTIRDGSPKEKIEAFKEWCDANKVANFRGALATLLQMLQVEDVPMRLILVRELAKVKGTRITAALAKRAVVDLSPQVREAAVAALEKRPAGQYVPILLRELRYPWAPVADRAALALRKLKPEAAVPKLIDLLDRPNPSVPVLDKKNKKPMVRELVRLNHMRNCFLCHAPSANKDDGLVRGLAPTPGKPLPRLYYAGQNGNFVRADITFLRQDFSVNLPVKNAKPWPAEQRFDFVTRLRPLQSEEMAEIADSPGNYPQREAVLYALHGITGKDGGDSSAKWRDLLGIAAHAPERTKDDSFDKTRKPSKDNKEKLDQIESSTKGKNHER